MNTTDTRLPKWLHEATRLSQAGQPDAALLALKTGLGAGLQTGSASARDLQARLEGALPANGRGLKRLIKGLSGTKAASGAKPSELQSVLDSVLPLIGSTRGQSVDVGRVMRGTHITASQGERDFRLVAPSDVSSGGDRPLIVMLHGCTQDADDFARGTRMDTIADAEGCFVLYPEQSSRANPQRCWNWFKHTHQSAERGEPAIVLGMIGEIIASHPIDARQVFVAGLSAGGAMAAVLADVAPERIAAVGIHSGLAAGAADDMSSAFAAMQGRSAATLRASGVPTIVLHGGSDFTVHTDNALGIVSAVEGASSGLLRHERVLDANGRQVTVASWSGAAGGAHMEHWHIEGAGHAWSGGDPAGSYTDAKGPDASREMLRFFLDQRAASVKVA